MKFSAPLTVLYDGRSVFLGRTSRILRRLDRGHRLQLTNTAMRKFEPQLYDQPSGEIKVGLHVQLPDETWRHGPEAFREACSAVGLGLFVLPTRLPLVRQLFDVGYQLVCRISSFRAKSNSDSKSLRQEIVVSKSVSGSARSDSIA